MRSMKLPQFPHLLINQFANSLQHFPVYKYYPLFENRGQYPFIFVSYSKVVN